MRAALLPLVLLVVSVVQGQQSTDPLVGQPCTPSYAPRCGNATILNETTGQSNQFGPNVCMKETLMRVQVYSYEYRRTCYNSWRGGRHCRLTCYCTNRCDAVQVTTKIRLHCCEGFTTKMYPSQYTLRHDGCPIKLEDTVLDCLDRLNRTMLLDDDSLDSIERRLDDSNVKTTLFIPTETALMNTEVDNETIASHLATGSFRAERLYGQQLMTAANGRFIQITSEYTTMVYRRKRLTILPRQQSSRRLFANGVEITGANACFAKNGVVHEINGVIMSSSRTILQVLDDTPELSSFKELINKAGLNKSLSSEYPKTVFALSNGAIDNNTMTCLCRPENRDLLRSFVEFYIVPRAEYNSTIRLNNDFCPLISRVMPLFIFPIYRISWCLISVAVNGSDTIVGGSRIVDADIPASNGVMHILSRPMNNPILNLSAQCPPPTTAPPSTTASSSSSTTVSESPSATRPPDETISRPTQPPTRPPDEA